MESEGTTVRISTYRPLFHTNDIRVKPLWIAMTKKWWLPVFKPPKSTPRVKDPVIYWVSWNDMQRKVRQMLDYETTHSSQLFHCFSLLDLGYHEWKARDIRLWFLLDSSRKMNWMLDSWPVEGMHVELYRFISFLNPGGYLRLRGNGCWHTRLCDDQPIIISFSCLCMISMDILNSLQTPKTNMIRLNTDNVSCWISMPIGSRSHLVPDGAGLDVHVASH